MDLELNFIYVFLDMKFRGGLPINGHLLINGHREGAKI